MASKKRRKRIAQKIAALERNIREGIRVEESEDEIEKLTMESNLGLVDMLEIDELVQQILGEDS